MFEVGRLYRRRDLHEAYGGQEQGGISTPRDHRFIFLFTGETGALYGYRDHWDDDGVFHLTGEGQLGDMELVRGNKAILEHARDGKELHLFQMEDHGYVRYIGEMACTGYDLVPSVPDRRGASRTAIVFRLVREGNATRKVRRQAQEVGTRAVASDDGTGNRPGDAIDEGPVVFAVGKRYRNRRGFYQIVAIRPPDMQIRYENGDLATVNIAVQERILANMRSEAQGKGPMSR
jgi:hypothetical protein